MANKITAYHVNDNNGEKERNNNTWMNEPNNNDSKVLNFHENETMATEGKNNTKYYYTLIYTSYYQLTWYLW